MEIRIAQPSEAQEARRIALAAYAPYVPRMDRRPAPMGADFTKLARAGQLSVALGTAGVLGYVVSWASGTDWQIENLGVSPQSQGTGLGAKLVEHAQDLAHAAGARRMTLYTNEVMREAIGFYGRLGFRETGRRREDGYNRVYFARAVRKIVIAGD